MVLDGDAQTNQTVIFNVVPQGGNRNLYTDGSTAEIQVASNMAMGFEIHLIAIQVSTGDVSFRKYEGAVKNLGSAALVGTWTEFIVTEDSNFIRITISASGTSMSFNVADLAGVSDINATAYVRWTQVIK